MKRYGLKSHFFYYSEWTCVMKGEEMEMDGGGSDGREEETR